VTRRYPSSSSFVAAATPHFPRGCLSVSRPHPSAFVAHHDAPLIGERAATRGRSATGGGDERAGVRRALAIRAHLIVGTPVANDATRDAHGRKYARPHHRRNECAAHRRTRRNARARRDGG
jgi:hypothetical protein